MAAIYLGDGGMVELARNEESRTIHGTLTVADVDAALRRFSFDFLEGALLTGDRVVIGTVRPAAGPPPNLELVAGHTGEDILLFVHVDAAGGLRLYRTFPEAINGSYDQAVPLVTPSANQDIYVTVRDSNFRGLAGVRSYELTTARETVDLTTLGEDFREQYDNGLISGQGQLDCFWDFMQPWCSEGASIQEGVEVAHFLAELVQRVTLGAGFRGRFFIKSRDSAQTPTTAEAARTQLYWEADCVITSVGFSFSPTAPVATQVSFVTTGAIMLRAGLPPGLLQQENGSLILQEDLYGILLDQPV